MKGLGTKVKTAIWLLVFIILAFTAGAQNPDEKKPEKKGLASKLKQVKIPDGLGPRIPGLSKIRTEEKSQEEGESEQSEEEAKFDEDEEDPDKMMEKMIRQLGHDPEMVKQMMDEENPDADPRSIVNPDPGVLAGIQPTPRNQGELVTYLKTFDAGADQAISPETAKQAGPYVGKGKQTKDAAYVFWMNGKQEAAAYLLLKAAIANPGDQLLLSNLGSVLTMAGYANKSIPLLDYLYILNPESSIVGNNLGQAWLSLGQVSKAKPLLEKTVAKYAQHPEANRSLARIALKENNTAQARSYLNNALKGGFSQEAYFDLKDMNANGSIDLPETLRHHHKRHYKSIAVTKRFRMPTMPGSVAQAITQEQEIEDFFHGIELTLAEINARIPAATGNIIDNQQKIAMQMAANAKRMNNLEDVKKQAELFAQVWNPFKLQAQEMVMAEYDDSYASSFRKRMQQLDESREMKIQEVKTSLKADERKISEMEKRLAKMETGEGESPAVQALENQICAARKKLHEKEVQLVTAINNTYVQDMESLAFQKLQEQTYWYTLYLLPQDPTGHNYRLYADYLATIARLKNSYPYPVPPLYTGNGCEIKQQVTVTPRGKLAQWEDTHCATYWDLDFHLVKSKFTCKEVQITASVEGVEFGVGQKYDPTSLETIEHSILFGGEIGKSATTLGNHLEVGVSAGAVATIKFDGSWNIKDVAIKVSAGAELGMHVPDSSDPGDSGPDIRQAASVGVSGGYEMSILTGFRGEAPQVNSIGNIFNR